MPTPSEDIRSELTGQTLGTVTLTEGANLFSRLPRLMADTPAPVVFVWEGVGAPPTPHMGVALDLYRPSVQIRVVCANNGMATGRDVARAILDFLHRRAISGYISCTARESAPIDLGENEAAQHEFGLNFDLIYRA